MIKSFRYDSDKDQFSANTYVVGEENGDFVVIDIGSTSDCLLKYVKEHFKSCLGILITHGHWDHIRGIDKFLDNYPNTTLFIDELDSKCLIDSRLNCSELMGENGIINIEPYRLEDGDEINFKNEFLFKVIETPFHTIGSVCYLYEKENALFTGDTLFKGDIGRCDLPHSAKRMQQISLEKIKKLDPNLDVYPGHGEKTKLKNEFENNKYLR